MLSVDDRASFKAFLLLLSSFVLVCWAVACIWMNSWLQQNEKKKWLSKANYYNFSHGLHWNFRSVAISRLFMQFTQHDHNPMRESCHSAENVLEIQLPFIWCDNIYMTYHIICIVVKATTAEVAAVTSGLGCTKVFRLPIRINVRQAKRKKKMRIGNVISVHIR